LHVICYFCHGVGIFKCEKFLGSHFRLLYAFNLYIYHTLAFIII
jgi:hypothetical protein